MALQWLAWSRVKERCEQDLWGPGVRSHNMRLSFSRSEHMSFRQKELRTKAKQKKHTTEDSGPKGELTKGSDTKVCMGLEKCQPLTVYHRLC